MKKDSLPQNKKIFVDLPYKDRPDMLDSENISIYDLHEDMQTVDPIPAESQALELKEEELDDKYNGSWTS